MDEAVPSPAAAQAGRSPGPIDQRAMSADRKLIPKWFWWALVAILLWMLVSGPVRV